MTATNVHVDYSSDCVTAQKIVMNSSTKKRYKD